MIEIKIDNEIYTEEQYKKDYVRMMDSLRQDHIGEKNCGGVNCGDCPLSKTTCSYLNDENSRYKCLETVKIVHNYVGLKQNSFQLNIIGKPKGKGNS